MTPPPVVTLPNDATPEQIDEVLLRDGCVIIKDYADVPLCDRVLDALEPLWDVPSHIPSEIDGTDKWRRVLPTGITRRYGLLHKITDPFIELLRKPHWRRIMDTHLVTEQTTYIGSRPHSTKTSILLANDIAIRLYPGAPCQSLHRDQIGFQMPEADPKNPLKSVAEIACFVALSDTIFENGATQVIVGSHLWPYSRIPTMEDVSYAEMTKGSAMFMLGSMYHAGGHNQLTADHPLGVRTLVTAFGQRDNLRPMTDIVMSTPWETALKLPEDIAKISGYYKSGSGLGFVEDIKNPIDVLKASQVKAS